jgi:type III secretory pathway lipoprotein EscJ
MRVLVLAVVIACAPQVDGPLDEQRTRDSADAIHLQTQLAALPGAVRAEVTLHRPVRDPLGATQPASAAVLVVVDDRADRSLIARDAHALLAGTAPEIADPQITVEVGAIRPQLARVGPFTVEAQDKQRLVTTLALGLLALLGLAGWIAYRERPAELLRRRE